MTIDMFFTCENIPAAARADAKVAIERVFAQLPILELPQHELQQLATAVREHVYNLYRQTAAQRLRFWRWAGFRVGLRDPWQAF